MSNLQQVQSADVMPFNWDQSRSQTLQQPAALPALEDPLWVGDVYQTGIDAQADSFSRVFLGAKASAFDVDGTTRIRLSSFHVSDWMADHAKKAYITGLRILGTGSFSLDANILLDVKHIFLSSPIDADQAARLRRWIKVVKGKLESGSAASSNLPAALTQPVVSRPSAAARYRVERLTSLEAALGMSKQELADVLRISRAGLYKWLDESHDVKLQEGNAARLSQLGRIATAWQRRTPLPLSAVKHEEVNGTTILAMLTAEELDEKSIVGALDEVLSRVKNRPKSPSQRLADAGFKRRATPATRFSRLSDDD